MPPLATAPTTEPDTRDLLSVAGYDGKSVADWLDWAEAKLKEADPMTRGAEGIFDSIADITEWSYQERRYGYDR